MKGETIKQIERREFQEALLDYEDALKTGNSQSVMLASIKVHRLRQTEADRKLINRISKTQKKKIK